MKLWSRGLGKIELIVEPDSCETTESTNGQGITVFGKIKEPVNWEFKVSIMPKDIPGFVKIMLNRNLLKFFLKSSIHGTVFHRNPLRVEDEKANLIQNVNHAYDQVFNR